MKVKAIQRKSFICGKFLLVNAISKVISQDILQGGILSLLLLVMNSNASAHCLNIKSISRRKMCLHSCSIKFLRTI